MISFNIFPNDVRVPFVGMEFDNSGALIGAQDQPYNALIVGQKTADGQAKAGSLIRLTNAKDAEKECGAGSMLRDQAASYLANDEITPLYALVLEDDPAANAAAGKVTFVGEATESGTLFVYVSFKRFTLRVTAGMTALELATAFKEAINLRTHLPVTAQSSSEVVTLVAKNKGEAANDLDFRINHYIGEKTPAGIEVKIEPFTGGTCNPDLMEYLPIIRDRWFNGVACPYLDGNNLMVLEEELAIRYGPLYQTEGFAFGSRRGLFSDLTSFGETRNSPHVGIMHAQGIPNAPWELSAAVCADAMRYGNMDPARPFQTLPLNGIGAPRDEDRFPRFPERNQLLSSGISTWYVDEGGKVRIERLITTYRKSENGADDISYLDVNTMLTLGYLRWDLVNHIKRKFPRCKLGNDGIHYGKGQAIVTPLVMKGEVYSKFVDWERRALVEEAEQFKDDLIVERNASNPNRLDIFIRPDLVNQFIVGAIQNQFILHRAIVETV